MRMVHLGQGKDGARVARVAVAADTASAEELARRDSQLVTLVATPAQLSTLRARLGADEQVGPAIHLTDPMAQAILRYPAGAEAAGMLRDLTHLLKHSWIG